MWASWNGHHEVVRTLLEACANVNAKSKVRNQLMMMMIVLMIMIEMFVDNDDRRSMYLC